MAGTSKKRLPYNAASANTLSQTEKGERELTDTKFVCSVCRSVFPEYRARTDARLDFGEEQIKCPNCGSVRVEPDHFDPDEPVEDPLEETEQEGYGP